jgi:hypothetical protein
MPKSPSNGRPSQRGGVAGRGKAPADPPPPTNPQQQLPEGVVPFDSDVEVSEEVIARLRSEAENSQLKSQVSALNAQLLETRNQLIRAKKTIEKLVEERDGKKKGKRTDKDQGGTPAQDGRRAASKESKPSGARAKRAGGSKPR